jgi:small subunit ribosomal protein S2
MEEKYKIDIEEMAKQGVHLGHRTSKTHPKMISFIFGVRNTIHILDLEKTKKNLLTALEFIENAVRQKKVILFVGTKPQIRDLIKSLAEEFSFPYINYKWVGGTFTNFSEIKKRVNYLKELEEKKESKEWEKHTKKERKEIEEEIRKLQEKFGGLRNLENLPDIIFISDLIKEKLAAKEAKRKGIKIVAICDTNANPEIADFPIPANDDAVSSVKYILEKVREAILNGTKNGNQP